MKTAKAGDVITSDIRAKYLARVFIEILASHQHPEASTLESRLAFLEQEYDWVEESFLMWECIRALDEIAPADHSFSYDRDKATFGFYPHETHGTGIY